MADEDEIYIRDHDPDEVPVLSADDFETLSEHVQALLDNMAESGILPEGYEEPSYQVSEYLAEQTGVEIGITDQELIMLGGGAAATYWTARTVVNEVYSVYNGVNNYVNIPGAVSIDDPRERMSNQLLTRGHASADEIMQASYGEWPPRGLDIVMDNPQRVQFGNISQRAFDNPNHNWLRRIYEQSQDLRYTLGDANIVADRTIRMNHFRLSAVPGIIGRSAYTSTLGHEGIHILQGDNFHRASEIYGDHYGPLIQNETQMILGENDVIAQVFRDHIDEGFMSSLPNGSASFHGYLSSGIETQARLHEVMIAGYQEWGQLPTNREELLVAMRNSGLTVPNDLMSSVVDSPTYLETLAVFRPVENMNMRAVNNLNFEQAALTEEGRLAFWGEAMPAVYADLIEMYGDGPGRARFGLGENVRPMLRNDFEAQRVATQAVDGADIDAPDGFRVPEADNPSHTPLHGGSFNAGLADDFLDATAEGVQEASRLARAARLGANAPVVGPALGVGGAVLTNLAHAGQRDYAEELRDQGVLSEEAYEAYITLNSNTEAALHADNGISTVDPTGISFILTAGVELRARGTFSDWADEYAPHLSEDQYQGLAMSMFSDSSARNEMIMEALDHLPDSIEGMPDYMHEIIESRHEYEMARAELSRTPAGPGPRHQQLSDEVDAMERDLVNQMEELMQHPQGVDMILDAVPVADRMDYVRRLAASEADPEAFAQAHPEIAAYFDAYEDSWTGMFIEQGDVLEENPDLLNDYIKARSGIVTEAAPDTNVSDLEDFSGPDAAYSGDPALIQELAATGIPLNPAFMLEEETAAAPNAIEQQTPEF